MKPPFLPFSLFLFSSAQYPRNRISCPPRHVHSYRPRMYTLPTQPCHHYRLPPSSFVLPHSTPSHTPSFVHGIPSSSRLSPFTNTQVDRSRSLGSYDFPLPLSLLRFLLFCGRSCAALIDITSKRRSQLLVFGVGVSAGSMEQRRGEESLRVKKKEKKSSKPFKATSSMAVRDSDDVKR